MNTKLTQDFDQLLDENTILSKKVRISFGRE